MIYSVTPDSGPSQLSIVIDTTKITTASRRWNMRIYQYECTSPVLGMYLLAFFIPGVTNETFPLARSTFSFQVEIILLLSESKASAVIR